MVIAITVTGKDRTGIIAALTGTLYRVGGNLEDASMTVLEGEFAMICLAKLKAKASLHQLQIELMKVKKSLGLDISIKQIKRSLVRGEKHVKGTNPWIVSAFGKDRAGIVHHISKLLADSNLNITDLNSKILGVGKKAGYGLVLEVDIPRKGLNRRLISLKKNFRSLEKKLDIRISLNPVESTRF